MLKVGGGGDDDRVGVLVQSPLGALVADAERREEVLRPLPQVVHKGGREAAAEALAK